MVLPQLHFASGVTWRYIVGLQRANINALNSSFFGDYLLKN
jgi:hypothetical protein